MTSELQVGLLGCLVMLLLLAGSMPVAFAMGAVGVIGFALLHGWPSAFSMITTEFYNTLSSNALTVIPLFVLMGQVSFHAGISRRLFHAANCWLGRLRGGLAMATVGACAAFGAICGSGPATAATMASVAMPEMRRYGYDAGLAGGTVAAGGGLGMLIPPSVVLICYGTMTRESIRELFLAGIAPGVLVAVLFCLTIFLTCRIHPALAPRAPGFSWKQRWRGLLGIGETLALFFLVMGGMFRGWFTPTEAAAVGAAGSIAIGLLRRTLTLRGLRRALDETVRTACMVMIIVAGATMFSRFLSVTRIPMRLAGWLAELPLPAWGVMGMMVLFFLLAGCFVDALALILLTIPIFDPVVRELGYSPVWFGIIIVLVTQMGVITPPVGVNVYVVSGIERDVPLPNIFRGALPFLASLICATALLIVFPQLALWLPRLASGG